jgi:hypothetical protein
VDAVFGTWSDWTWPTTSSHEEAWDDAFDGIELCSFQNGPAWEMKFYVDLEKLQEYARTKEDPRQDQLDEYLVLLVEHGTFDSNGFCITQRGHQKVVAGKPLGRWFFPWLSLLNLSKNARAAAAPSGTVEFDQPNAIVHFVVEMASELDVPVPLFRKYKEHKAAWRSCTATYMALSEAEAKKSLLTACFGFAFPSHNKPKLGAMPLLEGLASESKAVRQAACKANPNVVEAMLKAHKPRPETSTFAYLLFDREAAATRQFMDVLQTSRWLAVTPVYDAVLALPGKAESPHQLKTAEEVAWAFASQSGIAMQIKELTACADEDKQYLTDKVAALLLSNGASYAGEAMSATGKLMCLPSALVNLFPEPTTAHWDLRTKLENAEGPFTYKECLQKCENLILEPLTAFPDKLPRQSSFVVHEPRVGLSYGHAYGVSIQDDTCFLTSSTWSRRVQMPSSTFEALIREHPALKFFRTCMDEEHKRKKRRNQPRSSQADEFAFDPLDLLAGADSESAAEDVAGAVVMSIQREVDRERARLTTQRKLPGFNATCACRFCPFREFNRRDRLQAHVTKYHQKKHLFVASHRSSAQWNVAVALFEQDQSLAVLRPLLYETCLLEAAAKLIASWVQPDPATREFLEKQNDIDLVLLVTESGPRYVLKSQTANAARLTTKVYYDSKVASTLAGLLLKHDGKIQPVFHDLSMLFVSRGCQCAFLGLKYRQTQERLTDEVLSLPAITSLRTRLVAEATGHKEWEIISHDATFQILFSIIGQVPMAQKQGEAHALHTILGKSGALAGVSLQPTEGSRNFQSLF